MLKRKPLVPTDMIPDEIIGVNNSQMVKSHYKLSLKGYSPEKFESLIKSNFSEEDRDFIAEVYLKLRDCGYYPIGFDNRGEIRWGITLVGNVQRMVESKYPIKCDSCVCVGKNKRNKEAKCDGYSKEEIDKFKRLARNKAPISRWPEVVFDSQTPY